MVHSSMPGVQTSVKRRRFGPIHREVSVIGEGTWYIDHGDQASAIAALRRGLDLGMNHIDTAEMYGSGAAERLIGKAIAHRRDEVFLVSKVLPQNASRLGTRMPTWKIDDSAIRCSCVCCIVGRWLPTVINLNALAVRD